MGEEKRHEMMETLFGAESEDSEDEEPEALDRPATVYSEDEAEGGGQVEAKSEGERVGSELEKEESEAERVESEAERVESDSDRSYGENNNAEQVDRFMASERTRVRPQVSVSDSEESHEGDQAAQKERFMSNERPRARRQVSASGSEQSHEVRGLDEEEDEVEQVRGPSDQGDDERALGRVAEMRDVFGDSDEEEQELEDQQHSPQVHTEVSPSDDEGSVQKGIRPEDIVPDEEQHEEPYESDEDQPTERRVREKPVGPPLDIEIPYCSPPGHPDKMHIVRVSNIMGIELKPFDPKTYIEEESFVMDESGQKRLRLEDNAARWRLARNRDGILSYESNARFVRWSDGSMQLLIGNEVLDLAVQKAHQDQAHLFLNHGKGILQSQGRLLQKMKFMPSSLASKSHRLLTALVDSRNKKIYKVKNVITNKDPEREKEETEKKQEQMIRSKEDLQRKQEKINRKYLPVRERVEPQLSPGYLEGALEEEEEADEYNEEQKIADARRFQEQLEAEGKAEKKILNAKRQPAAPSLVKQPKDRRPLPPSSRELEDRFSDESEREASEYETDGQEDTNEVAREEDQDQEQEQEHEQEHEHEEAEDGAEEEEEEERGEELEDVEDEMNKKRKDRGADFEDETSPPRKPQQRRRVVVSDSDED